jgi:hypothetical protein
MLSAAFVLLVAASVPEPDVSTQTRPEVEGTWQLVKLTHDGDRVAPPYQGKAFCLVIQGRTLTYTIDGQPAFAGTIDRAKSSFDILDPDTRQPLYGPSIAFATGR